MMRYSFNGLVGRALGYHPDPGEKDQGSHHTAGADNIDMAVVNGLIDIDDGQDEAGNTQNG